MAAKQGTTLITSTESALGSIGGLSTSSTSTITACFPASPLGTIPQLTDDGTKDASANPMMKYYQDNVLNGTISGNSLFGDVSMNFDGTNASPTPPSLGEAETGAGGLPASAWVPNPVSPGPGSINPSDVGEAPADFGTVPNDTPGTGVGSQLGVVESSAQQAGATLGSYGLGSSPYSG